MCPCEFQQIVGASASVAHVSPAADLADLVALAASADVLVGVAPVLAAAAGPAVLGSTMAVVESVAVLLPPTLPVRLPRVADAVDARGRLLVAARHVEAVGDRGAARGALAVAPAVPAPAAVAEALAIWLASAGLRGRARVAGALDACDQVRLVAAVVAAVGLGRAFERLWLAEPVAPAVPAP
eukprot:CAMPEP_0183348164 /NCGR_PEP_ID=MMETSP0164_2-20130417/12767_1 /TAXON_ID=221442 /ORGANISM="Coccolithus pelagicus ssp braarudi, Strain PLY182g" /LENGTH=182 /DNA_ID=CAMNT_0025519719 /DNA_START=308 /DNA_END=852 /DNA_ORIENTATION=-